MEEGRGRAVVDSVREREIERHGVACRTSVEWLVID